MRTIGLIGGMSWTSTAEYYRILNESVAERYPETPNTSAKILMESLNFAEVRAMQERGDWEAAADYLGDSAETLQNAGANCVLICTNTMHKVADQVEQRLRANDKRTKLISIVDAVGRAVQSKNIKTIGLLGTTFTMQDSFYKDGLSKYGIQTVVPGNDDCTEVSSVIFNELCVGEIKDCSKQRYLDIIEQLGRCGAEGVILGCTEIPLLIQQDDVEMTIFDSTKIHAEAAVDFALQDA